MPRKKTKGDPVAVEAKFSGGPMDGQSLRVMNPPKRFIRLAFPDWGTYEWTAGEYVHVGNVRLKKSSLFEDPHLDDIDVIS